ncbi:chlorohydrolase [Streptococcus pneumoniae]|nr:chlorohydrolase [Streptococcus pneumoniae]
MGKLLTRGFHILFVKRSLYSIKIKEQTRKLDADSSKHGFEVVDETDEVSGLKRFSKSMKLKPIASKRSVVFIIQHKIHMFITLRRICLRACVVEKEQSYLKFLFFQKRPVSFLHVKSVLAGI